MGRKRFPMRNQTLKLYHMHVRIPNLHCSYGSGDLKPRNECKNLPWMGETWGLPAEEKQSHSVGIFSQPRIHVTQASHMWSGPPVCSGLVSTCRFHFLVKTLLSMQIAISEFLTKKDQGSLRNGWLHTWGSKCTRWDRNNCSYLKARMLIKLWGLCKKESGAIENGISWP